MIDAFGPWPIKHRAHIELQPSYLGARKGYAIAVPTADKTPVKYWCDQTQPEDRNDMETQFSANVLFSDDRHEAAIFASPEEAMEAFDRRAVPFLGREKDWSNVRLMMFRLREAKTAQ